MVLLWKRVTVGDEINDDMMTRASIASRSLLETFEMTCEYRFELFDATRRSSPSKLLTIKHTL
jgi:hypothetical protein